MLFNEKCAGKGRLPTEHDRNMERSADQALKTAEERGKRRTLGIL